MLSYLISPPYPIPPPNNLLKESGLWLVEGRLGAKAVGWKKFLFSKFKGGEVQRRGSWGGKKQPKKNFGENFGPKLPSPKLRRGALGGETSGGGRKMGWKVWGRELGRRPR